MLNSARKARRLRVRLWPLQLPNGKSLEPARLVPRIRSTEGKKALTVGQGGLANLW